MLYNKKCSNTLCNCREFYMMWDGYNIQLRCLDGHYNTNLKRNTTYKTMLQYDDVEDRTGFDDNKYSDGVIDLQSHNLENTANGDLFKQKDKNEREQKTKYKSERRANNIKQIKKTGTDNINYSVYDRLEIF